MHIGTDADAGPFSCAPALSLLLCIMRFLAYFPPLLAPGRRRLLWLRRRLQRDRAARRRADVRDVAAKAFTQIDLVAEAGIVSGGHEMIDVPAQLQ